MNSIALFQNIIPVEILDRFECGGVDLASVRALEGQPFVGGDTYPVRTEYATVKACDLQALAVFVEIPQAVQS
jgi:hypothetical protein